MWFRSSLKTPFETSLPPSAPDQSRMFPESARRDHWHSRGREGTSELLQRWQNQDFQDASLDTESTQSHTMNHLQSQAGVLTSQLVDFLQSDLQLRDRLLHVRRQYGQKIPGLKKKKKISLHVPSNLYCLLNKGFAKRCSVLLCITAE